MPDPVSQVANACVATNNLAQWIPVISTLAGGALGFLGSIVTLRWNGRTARKEAERKRASDRAFIGSQLLVLLAEYREACSSFATDPGSTKTSLPPPPDVLALNNVKGDWTVLDGELLLRLHRLPLIHRQYLHNLDQAMDILGPEHYLKDASSLFTKLSDECDYLISFLVRQCRLPSPLVLSD